LLPIDDANIRQPKTQSQVFFSRNIFLGFALKKISSWIAGAGTHPGTHPGAHAHTRAHQFATKKIPMQLDKQKGLSYHNTRVCVVSLGSLSK